MLKIMKWHQEETDDKQVSALFIFKCILKCKENVRI